MTVNSSYIELLGEIIGLISLRSIVLRDKKNQKNCQTNIRLLVTLLAAYLQYTLIDLI